MFSGSVRALSTIILVQAALNSGTQAKHMNLIVALEEEFSVRLPDEHISEMVSYKLIEFHLRALLPKE